MIDLGVLAWLIVLGIPILLLFSYETGILSFITWVSRQFRPKPKKPRQLTLVPFMHDRYPYEKHWVVPDEDSEYSELEGYESSAVMDEQDEEDN
jgi:hypothetical protein